jgi:carboxylate-amine ligase
MSRTVGVEEELLLYDANTRRLRGLGDDLTDETVEPAAPEGELPSVEHEFKRQQIETATSPQQSMVALAQDIDEGRRTVATRAAELGLAPAALATDPGGDRPATTDDARYRQMLSTYGEVATSQLACGMHVHVSVDSRDEGVAVIDQIRPWLPVLLAMSSNSPFSHGRDTDYASYRAMSWNMWPSAGPTEIFGSTRAYDEEVAALVAVGAALDEGMIYFDARLSRLYPTVEVRVMDVTPRVEDAVLLATLCRALVDTAAADWSRGEPPPAISRGLIRAATWRAARFGLIGELVHPLTSTLLPARDVVGAFLEKLDDALDRDHEKATVHDAVRRLFAGGTGAQRQREVFARRADIRDVVAAGCDWATP